MKNKSKSLEHDDQLSDQLIKQAIKQPGTLSSYQKGALDNFYARYVTGELVSPYAGAYAIDSTDIINALSDQYQEKHYDTPSFVAAVPGGADYPYALNQNVLDGVYQSTYIDSHPDFYTRACDGLFCGKERSYISPEERTYNKAQGIIDHQNVVDNLSTIISLGVGRAGAFRTGGLGFAEPISVNAAGSSRPATLENGAEEAAVAGPESGSVFDNIKSRNNSVVGKNPEDNIWSETRRKDPVENAYSHWDKHKSEFPDFNNSKEYVEAAHEFMNNPPEGTLVKVRKNGDEIFFNPAKDIFAIRKPDGTPKTMFKPDPSVHGYKNNMEYFNAQ